MMSENPRVLAMINQPEQFTFPLTLRNGEKVTFRPLRSEDAQRLGAYFTALSADTTNRFAPHAFTVETAQELADQVGQGDTVRMIAVRAESEEVMAYYLLEFATPEDDHKRYSDYGIQLDSAIDCRFAPSVLDSYQHSGLGMALMNCCQQIVQQLGCQRMILMGGVYVWNEKAVPYYIKAGFRKVGSFRVGTPKESDDMMLNLATNFHFQGQLTARDCKRHIPHSFELPPGCGQLTIRLHFDPFVVQDFRNMICITLFDPNGFRGAGHRGGNQHVVQISADAATPGYLAGDLPAGTWIVQLDTHMIMPGAPIHYELDISYTALTVPSLPSRPSQSTQNTSLSQRGIGWYRGDLHSHTDHSDGSRSVAELIQSAKDYHLDFIFLTDHNTISHLQGLEHFASDELLLAGGLELTTFYGHALCLGTRQWVDWRVRPGNSSMAEIALQSYAHNQVFIIAHPEAIGDPSCTGCRWRYGEMMPGTSNLVEIWNGPWGGESNNENALSLYYDWLNQGRRLVATAGTDTHSSKDYAERPGFNVIYAETLSEAALLQAIKLGHLYLSSGPQLVLSAQNEAGQTWMMGDQVDQTVTLVAEWAESPADGMLRVIANGRLQSSQSTGSTGRVEWQIAPEEAAWVVVELRSAEGELLAITNPIFMR